MYDACMKREPKPTAPSVHAFLPLSAVDYHVLLVLSQRDLYGYAILRAIAEESTGAVRMDIGSLYRALARLEAWELVEPVSPPDDDTAGDAHPGRPRRYYRLCDLGRTVLTEEAKRLQSAVRLAEERKLIPGATRS